jgi:hypothetical protein
MEVVASARAEHRASRRRRNLVRSSLGLALIVAALWAANVVLIAHPVRDALAADSATAGVRLSARFQWYVDPTTLVLDLRAADPAAPQAAFRALLVTAVAMRQEQRTFGRVVLARAGTPVYVLSGDDFQVLAAQFASGGNPFDVLRSIPPLLRGTAGSSAFGLFGATPAERLGERDLDTAARRWIGAAAP